MTTLQHIFLFIFIALNFMSNPLAWCLAIGTGADTAFETVHNFDPMIETNGGWQIGQSSVPIEINASPDAGAWVKHLSGFLPPLKTTTYSVREHWIIGSGSVWIDWHKNIIASPGWIWSSATITLANGATVPGLTISGLGTTAIDFDFPPLAPGTLVSLWKQITCDPLKGPCSSDITIKEFPTLPIPGILWLLGTGLVGLSFSLQRQAG